MKTYEGLFIFPPDSAPEARKNQLKNIDDLIQKHHGQISQKLEWGKKPIGYAIRKFREAYMLVYDFSMNPAEAPEFRKGLELQEDLMKSMITIKKEPKVKIKPEKAAGTPLVEKPVRSSAPAPATA